MILLFDTSEKKDRLPKIFLQNGYHLFGKPELIPYPPPNLGNPVDTERLQNAPYRFFGLFAEM